jgi:1-acyl-sn-glycerol-3-phosphate acyltransferase
MTRLLRAAFIVVVVRPILTIILGENVRRRDLLPKAGPAVIVANHNSHLDTLTILSMFPLALLPKLRPVAAMDYFLKTRLMAWFALNIIGIIPIARGGHDTGADPLEPCYAALDRGEILILFPEGSRGEPETLQRFKKGIAWLSRARPQVPIHPVFMRGLGKVLPKDSMVPVPFNCDVVCGEPFVWTGDIDGFMAELQARMAALAEQIHAVPWE